MTEKEKAVTLIKVFKGNISFALLCVEEVREELLKQYNQHYTEDHQMHLGYWCNSEECKFWTGVKRELDTRNRSTVTELQTNEQWQKNYYKR